MLQHAKILTGIILSQICYQCPSVNSLTIGKDVDINFSATILDQQIMKGKVTQAPLIESPLRE